MLFETELVEGELLRRYRRFFADVRLADGRVVVCHCANPGSMLGCAPAGGRVWVRPVDDPRRKLAFTWELVEVGGALVCVNTQRANEVVAEALAAGAIGELAGYDTVRREVRCGDRSRIDFLLERGEERCFVEVKSVTLGVGDGASAFPDSVTERGTRHLRELMTVAARSDRAVLLFCAGRGDTRRVRPADEIDPVYGRALREAVAAGVEVLAFGCAVTPRELRLGGRVPVSL
jgi:sugar fermentation stimulation protein A